MRSTPLIASLLMVAGAVQAAAPGDAALQRWLRQRYGKDLRTTRPLVNVLVQRRLPGVRFHAVDVWNPKSVIAGRQHHPYAVAFSRSGAFTALERSTDVAAFLGGQGLRIPDAASALEIGRVYAALRRAAVVESAKALDTTCRHPALHPTREAAIRPPAVTGTAPVFTVTLFAILDPGICAVSRIELRLGPGGQVAALEAGVSARSGYD